MGCRGALWALAKEKLRFVALPALRGGPPKRETTEENRGVRKDRTNPGEEQNPMKKLATINALAAAMAAPVPALADLVIPDLPHYRTGPFCWRAHPVLGRLPGLLHPAQHSANGGIGGVTDPDRQLQRPPTTPSAAWSATKCDQG